MKPPPSPGFTLVELLVTVALLIVVLALGVPSFQEMVLNNRRTTQLNDMMTSLILARSEAVRRGTDAVVCISDGAANPDCDAAATDWEDGWLVIADSNKDDVFNPAVDDLVQVQEPLADGTTLRGNTNVTRIVRFDPRGFSATAGTLRLCDPRGQGEARGIVVSPSGRPRLAIDTNSPADGIVDDGSGNNLSCP